MDEEIYFFGDKYDVPKGYMVIQKMNDVYVKKECWKIVEIKGE